MRLRPSFFLTVPDKNPRTECACQPAEVSRSEIFAPFFRRSSARITSFLVLARVLPFARFFVVAFDFAAIMMSSLLHCEKPGVVNGRAGGTATRRSCGPHSNALCEEEVQSVVRKNRANRQVRGSVRTRQFFYLNLVTFKGDRAKRPSFGRRQREMFAYWRNLAQQQLLVFEN